MAGNKIKFITQYDRLGNDNRFHCDSGSRIETEYEPVYDQKGIWHLEKSGETNKYLEIQSYADSCDINVIMARYRNGETDVLQQIQGTYGDVSEVPTNYADLMNAKIQAENLFMSLAPDIREKYGNDVVRFMSEIGTKEGLEKLGYSFDTPEPAPASAPAPADNKEGDVKE